VSNLSDALEAVGVSNGVGVNLLGGAAGIFADISGVIDLVTLLSTNNQVLNKLSDIQRALNNAFSQLHADDRATRIIDRENRLNDAYSLSDSVLGTLQADVEANLDWAARSDRIEKCIQAVDQLDFNAQFLTIFDDEIYYQDWWSGRGLGPAPSGALVFTDRYTLPAYMRAVLAFVMVIRAFDPQYREHNAGEIQKYMDRLTTVHDLSAGGVKLMPIPDWPSATSQWSGGDGGTPFLIFLPQNGPFRKDTPWLGAVPKGNPPSDADTAQPFGAVHVYSGTSAQGEFPRLPNLGQNEHPKPNPAVLYARFEPKVVVAAHGRRKRLYTLIGMSELRDFIDGLRKLLGQASLGADPGRWWSLREVAYLLDELGHRQITVASQGADAGPLGPTSSGEARWWETYKLNGAVSARDVIGRLTDLSHLPPSPPKAEALSWRNALDRSLLDEPVNDPLKWW
jgi:hypothetical protein